MYLESFLAIIVEIYILLFVSFADMGIGVLDEFALMNDRRMKSGICRDENGDPMVFLFSQRT